MKTDRRKSKYFTGKIDFHCDKKDIVDMSKDFGEGAIKVVEKVNFRRYSGEHVEIITYRNGITEINFSGVRIKVPTDRIAYFDGDED